MMTVIPTANSSSGNSPVCTNLTYPAANLDVQGFDHTGTLYVVPRFTEKRRVDKSTDRNMAGLTR
jgi:hypothetical protein